MDPITSIAGKFFEILSDPLAILDDYGSERSQICYVAGQNLNVKSSELVSALLYGYIALPTVSPPAALFSWIATDYPELIHMSAAAKVLGMIGQQEDGNKWAKMAMELNMLVHQNNLLGVAR
jgi:hypothetical protein